jgi:hypothetical protein
MNAESEELHEQREAAYGDGGNPRQATNHAHQGRE